jgi:hypothetical protein
VGDRLEDLSSVAKSSMCGKVFIQRENSVIAAEGFKRLTPENFLLPSSISFNPCRK